MPKYVLDPDGTIKNLDKIENGSFVEKGPRQYAREHINEMAGAPANRNADINVSTSANEKSTARSIFDISGKPSVEDSFFASKENPKHNSSFGADDPIETRKNFNDYLNNNQIFSTELEMISGVDILSSKGGIRDLGAKLSIAFNLIAEASVYIGLIEGLIAAEALLNPEKNISPRNELDTKNGIRENDPYNRIALGNFGPISSTALTKYINNVLNYPYQREGVEGGFFDIPANILDRLSAYFIGFSEFLNPDRQIYSNVYDSIKEFLLVVKNPPGGFNSPRALAESFTNIALFLIDTVTSLTNLESNRLKMLVRKFNTQKNWHETKLYKAKNKNITGEGDVESFLVNLNYYYVKFIIERMNIGLKIKKYYRNKGESHRKFNRSGRLKDSKRGLTLLSYTADGKLTLDPFDSANETNKYRNNMKQSMSNASLPQAFIMPESLKRSMFIAHGKNKLSEAFTDEHVKSYFLTTKKKQERISQDAVKKLEAYYEKEMMPFYFQDLRTNELIGFHAFIESITDNYNPNYTTTKGFGRIDDVRHYVDTTRNVNLTFVLAAMSKADHDLMWYQINKIVSMVYPQWSRGFKATDLDQEGKPKENKEGFEYPFTQVPTASPLIRIRLGDVLKSNYTKHAIEKIHGSSNNKDIDTEEATIPTLSPFLKAGEYVTNKLEDVKMSKDNKVSFLPNSLINNGYNLSQSGIMIVKVDPGDQNSIIYTRKNTGVDALGPQTLIVTKDDIVFKETGGSNLNNQKDLKTRKEFKNYSDSHIQVGDSKVLNNPITAAFESTLGKGLAGFITMLDVNYQDQLWETVVEGSKAPKVVKISVNFAPLHDIPPGLDADGAMRAPVYNAGKIINTIYGDVYDK